MTDDSAHLDRLLGQLAREGSRQPDPAEHPPSEMLSAYAAKELPPEEELKVQEHLAVCRRCRDLIVDFASFMETPLDERPEGVADLTAVAEWRELRSKLKEDAKFERRRNQRPARRLSYAVAAALLVTVVGISLYSYSRPDKLLTLQYVNAVRGKKVATSSIQLPVTLLLESPARNPYPEYMVEILDHNHQLIKKIVHLHENAHFEIEIPLWRWSLDPGVYQIKLMAKGQSEPVGEYAFRIVDQ